MPRVAPPRMNSRSWEWRVTTHHDEVGAAVRGMVQDRARNVVGLVRDRLQFDLQAMPGQVLGDIRAYDFIAAFNRVDGHDLDRASVARQRERIGHGAGGITAAIPAHHDTVKLDAGLLDIGHDQDRPA